MLHIVKRGLQVPPPEVLRAMLSVDKAKQEVRPGQEARRGLRPAVAPTPHFRRTSACTLRVLQHSWVQKGRA